MSFSHSLLNDMAMVYRGIYAYNQQRIGNGVCASTFFGCIATKKYVDENMKLKDYRSLFPYLLTCSICHYPFSHYDRYQLNKMDVKSDGSEEMREQVIKRNTNVGGEDAQTYPPPPDDDDDDIYGNDDDDVGYEADDEWEEDDEDDDDDNDDDDNDDDDDDDGEDDINDDDVDGSDDDDDVGYEADNEWEDDDDDDDKDSEEED